MIATGVYLKGVRDSWLGERIELLCGKQRRYRQRIYSLEEGVRQRQKRGEYDSVTDGSAFATMLTEHFRDVSHDKHLGVNFSPVPLPAGPRAPNSDAAARFRKQMERINCGFEKVEILTGNIGYVKFNMFADPEVCGPTAIAAMNFLGNVDAVIFDLRENGGGDPKMVALISTYLFAKPSGRSQEPKNSVTTSRISNARPLSERLPEAEHIPCPDIESMIAS